MVLEPGGGLSFPPPPPGATINPGNSGSSPGSNGSSTVVASPGSVTSAVSAAGSRLFQRAAPVFPFHLGGWHHPQLLGAGGNQTSVQQSLAAAAAVRFLGHHHHHPHPALAVAAAAAAASHPALVGPGGGLVGHAHEHCGPGGGPDDDDDKKGSVVLEAEEKKDKILATDFDIELASCGTLHERSFSA
ncbi:hypothetical protein QAD02_017515 [Eretmocerus hayati]|uniref:Uncharacterized protein n=1 Tax=Eretmocerus hayati TaxID=131215 RepID=A0ACC2PF72_9HYME|nr:hypothetical protein QAD02_017515 [Eretmocerus hayati]